MTGVLGTPKSRTTVIHFPLTLSLKLDDDTLAHLDDIALYERMRRSAFIRTLLVDAVQRYQRNPAYLRYRRQLDQRKVEEWKPRRQE